MSTPGPLAPGHGAPPSSASFWDQNYGASAGYKYGEQPNAFLVAQAARLLTGARVLLPGDGEGRNSVWLAGRGHAVSAVDASSVAIARAQALAQRRGVRIDTTHADLLDWRPAAGAFDAVVCTYLHLPPALRQPVHRALAQALRPGGLLLLEAFHPDQLRLASGGPKDADLLYTLARLREDFGLDLRELLGEETDTVLDEGPGHQGPARVTRWIGQR